MSAVRRTPRNASELAQELASAAKAPSWATAHAFTILPRFRSVPDGRAQVIGNRLGCGLRGQPERSHRLPAICATTAAI